MFKCNRCGSDLEKKEKKVKLPIQMMSDPEIAIITVNKPLFCLKCKEYFFDTTQIKESLKQISTMIKKPPMEIKEGIYK